MAVERWSIFCPSPVLEIFRCWDLIPLPKRLYISWTQGIRAELAAQVTQVFGVFPGPIETDMAKDFDMGKSSPDLIADGTLSAIEQGVEDIFIDPMAVQFRQDYFSDPKALEAQLSKFHPG